MCFHWAFHYFVIELCSRSNLSSSKSRLNYTMSRSLTLVSKSRHDIIIISLCRRILSLCKKKQKETKKSGLRHNDVTCTNQIFIKFQYNESVYLSMCLSVCPVVCLWKKFQQNGCIVTSYFVFFIQLFMFQILLNLRTSFLIQTLNNKKYI